jgi:hypothetical protein
MENTIKVPILEYVTEKQKEFQCGNKRKFETSEEAIYCLRKICKNDTRMNPTSISIYRCPHCKNYHFGSRNHNEEFY